MFPADYRFPAEKARLIASAGKYLEAVIAVAAALEINPHAPALLAAKAVYQIRVNDAAGAVSTCDAALAIDQVHAGALLHKAYALIALQQDYDAEAVLRAGIAAVPDEVRLVKALANLCLRREKIYRSPEPCGLGNYCRPK